MNEIKNIFSIKDLENISGIKAHTIRIWEKRYMVFEPMRSDTNIRFYDLQSLQKLLNITLLHNYGYKISKIAKYPPEKIPELVNEIISEKNAKNHAISAFKLAMMRFDQVSFLTTYNNLLSKKSFQEVFHEVFIPLLNEIGLLWQTNTISISHEHFITYLIKQKIIVNTEQVQINIPINKDRVFVCFLPVDELHELGLMYLNYEISAKGYKTIFLGECVPIEDLKDLKRYFCNITFLTYMTIAPDKDVINSYIDEITNEVLNDAETELWILGNLTKFITPNRPENIKIFDSITAVTQSIK